MVVRAIQGVCLAGRRIVKDRVVALAGSFNGKATLTQQLLDLPDTRWHDDDQLDKTSRIASISSAVL